MAQVLALGVAALIYAYSPAFGAATGDLGWGVLALAFAGLRLAALNTNLVASTYVLDAIGITVLIGGTGDAHSPFLAIALAGAWWAGQKGGRGTLYGLAFAVAYLLLVAPQAVRNGELAAVMYQPAFVWALGAIADRLDASPLSGAVTPSAIDPAVYENKRGTVKAGLTRAVGGGLVPIDAVLTAGQLGLTANQTELIPFLMLGASNQDIADALSVSEATVRYRLTRLYRSLGVKGRKAAAERALELGLGALLPASAPKPT
ncbi:MAG TPA: helix-turn-helix transcriptional regulator [Candidatus Limnocylindria bacterium]|nr:helix-turn-helix transcriptional regulator [Candidatus Limnocylindria bacterium]